MRPGASGAMLPLDCSELPGQILPAEAPIILSQPRTGKADYYELTWRPRHERGVPVLEYMVKYRKVCSLPESRFGSLPVSVGNSGLGLCPRWETLWQSGPPAASPAPSTS